MYAWWKEANVGNRELLKILHNDGILAVQAVTGSPLEFNLDNIILYLRRSLLNFYAGLKL